MAWRDHALPDYDHRRSGTVLGNIDICSDWAIHRLLFSWRHSIQMVGFSIFVAGNRGIQMECIMDTWTKIKKPNRAVQLIAGRFIFRAEASVAWRSGTGDAGRRASRVPSLPLCAIHPLRQPAIPDGGRSRII